MFVDALLMTVMTPSLVGRESYGGGGLLLPELGVHGASFLVASPFSFVCECDDWMTLGIYKAELSVFYSDDC
jgi:hypothetical protein